MLHELPNFTLNSVALLQSQTNKPSPHPILKQASLLRSTTSKDSPHFSRRSIGRPKIHKTQEYVDGGDREFQALTVFARLPEGGSDLFTANGYMFIR